MEKLSEDEMLLEHLRVNGMADSYRALKAQIDAEKSITSEDILENSSNPISEYNGLTDQMREKIKKIIDSLKENKEIDDRDEKDTLDEKDGKEELSKDKKNEVEEKQRENGKEKEENQEKQNDDKELDEEKKEKNQDNKKEEIPKMDEYLSDLKRLHKMRIVDYKDQMRKDDPRVDKYFITMMYLQKSVNRQRQAFIKEYGSEELNKLENEYLKEELKYEKTLNKNMDKDLAKLKQLDAKLDSILDKMQTFQKSLKDGSMSLEQYNYEIDALEDDKLDTLWQINRINPGLIEEKQENIKTRELYEKKATTASVEKARKKDMTPQNKEKSSILEYNEKKQDGVAEEIHEEMKDTLGKNIYDKEKRLDDLRKKLKGVDITTPDGKKEALEIIGEIQTLESQKMSEEKQVDNLEKNMDADVQNYSDLKSPEEEREDVTEEFENMTENIKPEEVSDGLMAELRNQALEDPSTPQQAEEYLDNINEISEDAGKMQDDKEKEADESEAPTLFSIRKRPY